MNCLLAEQSGKLADITVNLQGGGREGKGRYSRILRSAVNHCELVAFALSTLCCAALPWVEDGRIQFSFFCKRFPAVKEGGAGGNVGNCGCFHKQTFKSDTYMISNKT